MESSCECCNKLDKSFPLLTQMSPEERYMCLWSWAKAGYSANENVLISNLNNSKDFLRTQIELNASKINNELLIFEKSITNKIDSHHHEKETIASKLDTLDSKITEDNNHILEAFSSKMELQKNDMDNKLFLLVDTMFKNLVSELKKQDPQETSSEFISKLDALIENHSNTLSSNTLGVINETSKMMAEIKSSVKGLISSELSSVSRRMEEMNDTLCKTYSMTQKSVIKGKISEDIIYNEIVSKFPDDWVELTRNKNKSGDIIYQDNKTKQKVLIDIKNYSSGIQKCEIDKLKRDQLRMGCSDSILVSFGPIQKYQRFDIENFEHDGNSYTILFMPNVSENYALITWGIIFLKKMFEHWTKLSKDFSPEDNVEASKKLEEIKGLVTMLGNHYSNAIELKSDYEKELEKIDKSYGTIRNRIIQTGSDAKKIFNDFTRIIEKTG